LVTCAISWPIAVASTSGEVSPSIDSGRITAPAATGPVTRAEASTGTAPSENAFKQRRIAASRAGEGAIGVALRRIAHVRRSAERSRTARYSRRRRYAANSARAMVSESVTVRGGNCAGRIGGRVCEIAGFAEGVVAAALAVVGTGVSLEAVRG